MTQNNDIKSSQPNLPEEVRQELFKSSTFDLYEEIINPFSVDIMLSGKLGASVLKMLKGTMSVDEFPSEVENLLSVSQEDAKKICVGVFSKVLYRFHAKLDWIDFEKVITDLGGSKEDVEWVTESAEDFVKKYVLDLHGVTDKRAMHRLEVAFLSLLKNEHTKDEIIEQLQRPVKLNGLEIDEKNASGLVQAFLRVTGEKGITAVIKPFAESEPETRVEPVLSPPVAPTPPPKPPTPPKEKPVAPPAPPAPSKPEPKPEPVRVELAEPIEIKKEPPKLKPAPVVQPKPEVVSKPRIEAFSEEDAKEIEKIKVEKKDAVENALPASVDEVVQQICQFDAFKFEDGLLSDRCAKIIESRVRDVRDPYVTRKRLELPVDQGGLGVKGRQLADMTEHIEKTVSAYESQAQDKIHDEKRLKRRVQEVVGENKDARERKKERMMNQRYTAITGRAPTETVHPVGPKNARTSAAVAAHVEMQQLESKIDKDKVREVIERSKAPKQTMPSRPAIQPKMVDVVSSKRLAGPTEELSRLSLTDFRRLSKDPIQATTKIKDKIDLLENRGYELKVAGIKAWRMSSLNQIYMKLAERAVLEGVPLGQVLESMRGAGEETLTDEELKAIMNLNATLRF